MVSKLAPVTSNALTWGAASYGMDEDQQTFLAVEHSVRQSNAIRAPDGVGCRPYRARSITAGSEEIAKR